MILIGDVNTREFADLLRRYGLEVVLMNDGASLPGSYWGEPEAGLVGHCLYLRPDTPIHSALHEACHFICMDTERRSALNTDAGGEFSEENGVCYLQILLADHVAETDRQRMFRDMDEWGYSFRLGSTRAWFEQDAEEARDWLLTHRLIDRREQPTWRVRE